jgi:hypothetical protein
MSTIREYAYGASFEFFIPQNPVQNATQPHGVRTAPTPNPCGAAIPTESNDRAVLATLLGEADNSLRVSYAHNLYDGTLDRSYDYDHLGRLQVAHTGAEARAL